MIEYLFWKLSLDCATKAVSYFSYLSDLHFLLSFQESGKINCCIRVSPVLHKCVGLKLACLADREAAVAF